MNIEDWGVSAREAATAVGCTISQFRNVVDRHAVDDLVETRRGRRSEYRLIDLLRIRLALDLKSSGLVPLAKAVGIANRSNVLHAYLTAGALEFGLVDGALVEAGWSTDHDPRIVFPLDGAGTAIVEVIRSSVAALKGEALANTAAAVFAERLRVLRSGRPLPEVAGN